MNSNSTDTGQTQRLLPHHLEHLRQSGLSDETIQGLGFYSAGEQLLKKTLANNSGLVCEPVATDIVPELGLKTKPVLPIIWETGNASQIRSLLVLREAELILAKAQLTGNPPQDWYVRNQICDLEIKIADLRKWLAEAMKGNSGSAECQ